MNLVCRSVRILVLVGVAAVSGYAQDDAQTQTTSDQQQTSTHKDGLRNGTTTLLTGFGINLMREFVFNW